MLFSRLKAAELHDDSGYATVAAAGFSAALVSVLALVALQMGSSIARAQAQVAADLAAVAGASALAMGEPPDRACAIARETAELNSASLELCTAKDEDLTVEALVRGRLASAAAGPL